MPYVTAPDRTKYIRGSPQHPTIKHLKLTAPALNSLHRTEGQERNPCDEARDTAAMFPLLQSMSAEISICPLCHTPRMPRKKGEARVDCQWSEWNSWPPCSVTCGEGQYNCSGFERRHWTRACPITGRQVFRDGEEAKTSFFVYFGGDHSIADCIGKRGD